MEKIEQQFAREHWEKLCKVFTMERGEGLPSPEWVENWHAWGCNTLPRDDMPSWELEMVEKKEREERNFIENYAMDHIGRVGMMCYDTMIEAHFRTVETGYRKFLKEWEQNEWYDIVEREILEIGPIKYKENLMEETIVSDEPQGGDRYPHRSGHRT